MKCLIGERLHRRYKKCIVKNAKVKNETTTVSEERPTFKSIEEKDVVQKEIKKNSTDNYKNTTVTEETVTSNVTDVITSTQESTSEVETVVYNLPPDLSVYGTWQLQENATLKIKFDKSYVYTVDDEDGKSVWTGTHAISVCGKKALTKTGLTSRQVRMRYGVAKNKFNIDNFYYICLPYEYVSFDGGEKVEVESDFSDKLVELYLYLYNDKDGNLVADNYIPRDGESALMDQIVQIKGEEL